MKFARATTDRPGHTVCSKKWHRAAALKGAGAFSNTPLRPRGFGVRQSYAAFTRATQSSHNSNHASHITRRVAPITNHQSPITPQSAFTLAEVLAALVFMAIL